MYTGVNTEKFSLALESNCDITKTFFSEKNKELIEKKVRELLENEDIMKRTLSATIPANLNIASIDGTVQSTLSASEKEFRNKISNETGQQYLISIGEIEESKSKDLLIKKIEERNNMKVDICKDICFDRLEDYMMRQYNLFIERQFVDSDKRVLIFEENDRKKKINILNYLDCRVVTDVLKEAKLSLEQHYQYITDLNTRTRVMQEPLETRIVKEPIKLPSDR